MVNQEYALLRRNVSMLGRMLGNVVRRAEGDAAFDRVETIRKLAKAAREGDDSSSEKLQAILSGLDKHELLPVVRAFSHFLKLANIAEQHHGISRAADSTNSATKVLESAFNDLFSENISPDKLIDAVVDLHIELVITAHPTEITRRSLIDKHVQIERCLGQLELSNITVQERHQVIFRLEELIAHLWHTDEFRAKRPTPVDEAKWGLAVLENSLWEAVPEFLRRLDDSFHAATGQKLSLDARPVSFVSWMGGDRDGNPNVTAKVTREVLLLNRWKAIDLYSQDVAGLLNELSMWRCNDELAAATDGATEPYRFILRQLRSLLRHTLDSINAELEGEKPTSEPVVEAFDQLWEPLYLCYTSLHESGMGVIADGRLLDTLRRLQCFGLHLYRLDIRQESSRHTQALSELTQYLELGDYSEWNEQQRQAFLSRELTEKRPLLPIDWQPSEATSEVLDTCCEIARQPEGAITSYIISMAKTPSDVLAVKVLLKACGASLNLPVAPLFETLDDLNNAADVMSSLLTLPAYRDLLSGEQMVMIGYSDSAKDAGMLAAGWAQYQAQEQLLQVCDAADVPLKLFHGRGGTVGRGGAPTHAALLSQPPGSLRSGLRVTVQGEMIQAELGLSAIAIKSLAMYTSAILQANLTEPPKPKVEWQALMQQLANKSCAAYRSVVRDNPDFVPYFRVATPEQELGKLPLGSRPTKRRQGGGLETLRAIPWIFAWSQNRLMLPAWLGAGQALQEALDAGQGDLLETLCREWPFFSTRLSLLEMVFAKADPALSKMYDTLLVSPDLAELGNQLRGQLKADIQTVLNISNDENLMQDLPWIRESVQKRNTYTDPLNVLQAELLCRNRQQPNETLERALMVTISGIAAGMRNTG